MDYFNYFISSSNYYLLEFCVRIAIDFMRGRISDFLGIYYLRITIVFVDPLSKINEHRLIIKWYIIYAPSVFTFRQNTENTEVEKWIKYFLWFIFYTTRFYRVAEEALTLPPPDIFKFPLCPIRLTSFKFNILLY